MKKVRIIIPFIVIMSFILLITESSILRFDKYGFGDLDWVDGLFYNNQFYEVEYTSSDHQERV